MIGHAISRWFTLPVAAEGHFGAIADIHGRADLLEAMINLLDRELPSQATTVFLGDLIDRGPESIRTIDLAMAGIGGRPNLAIAGNHESMLLHGIDPESDPDIALGVLVLWNRQGGASVIAELDCDGYDPVAIRDALGAERFTFLREMLPNHVAGSVIFAHAGVDPRKAVAPQLDQPVLDIHAVMDTDEENMSMRWVRRPWVGFDGPLDTGQFVVYGHTIQKGLTPMVTSCQAGIDLGAYSRGILCAAEIDGARIRFLFVGPDGNDTLKKLEDYTPGLEPAEVDILA